MIPMIMVMAKAVPAGTEAAIDFMPHRYDNNFMTGTEENPNYE